jgi:amino-acid N-acetyltransferase
MALNTDHIKWFRGSSPYIDAHRDKTIVIRLAGDALESDNFANVIADIALMDSLGAKIIVIFGSDKRIEQLLEEEDSSWSTHGVHRITTASQIKTVTSTMGQIYADLFAKFSASSLDSPSKRNAIKVSSGNFIRAKPIGIKDGLDHQLSGLVRSVDEDAIEHQLASGSIVLIPSIGYSPSGEIFHLDSDIVAREVACALTAHKLIFMTEQPGIKDNCGGLISEIDLSDPKSKDIELQPLTENLLNCCDQACQHGVARCHIISFAIDGALLEELFTRDGCGTQIIGNSYEQIRPATTEDVPGILRLIEPLEGNGVLVKRSRELLESEIENFMVIERDGLLISCAALYRYETAGELACLVTHPDYRKSNRGDRLLEAVEKSARATGLEELFVLTTQSAHWFSERGFRESKKRRPTCQKERILQQSKKLHRSS